MTDSPNHVGGDTLYLLGESQPVEMRSALFASEDDLQDIIARYPALLAGAQMTPDDPRRWLLVQREMGLPIRSGDTDNFSVDHLFVDHEAIPTVVEVKRSTDSRIRREVVGQMLDYAANGVRYWPVDRLRRLYEEQCRQDERDPLGYLRETVGPDVDPDDFWVRVGEHLEIGRIRMVFVADLIPPELQRIVEFLNEGMTRAQVYAVEIPQYQAADGRRSVVPRLIGATAWATTRPGRDRDRPSLEEVMAGAPEHIREAAERLAEVAGSNGLERRRTRTAELFARGGRDLLWFAPKEGVVWLYLNHLRDNGKDLLADELLSAFQALVPSKRLTRVQPGVPVEALVREWEVARPILERYLTAAAGA